MNALKAVIAYPIFFVLFAIRAVLTGTAGFFRAISDKLEAGARKIDPFDGWL